MPSFFDLPLEIRQRIYRQSVNARRADSWRRFRSFVAYGRDVREARRIYRSVRAMMIAGRFRSAENYMRQYGVANLPDGRVVPAGP